jgi:hypothetical protein
VTSSEIAFLAVGLVLGAALGAALVQVVRARPASRREVRLTITQNAIPPRTGPVRSLENATAPTRPIAAGAPGATRLPALPPAPGGAAPARPEAAPGSPVRTRVPSPGVVLPSTAIAVPVGEPAATPAAGGAREARPQDVPPRPPTNQGPQAGAGGGNGVALAIAGAATAVAVLEAPRRSSPSIATAPVPPPGTAVPPAPLHDPASTHRAVGLRPEAFTTLVRPRSPVDAPQVTLPAGAVGVAVAPAAPQRPLALIGGLAPIVRPVLAPPSGPTLTRPRASARPHAAAQQPGSRGAAGSSGPAASAPGVATDPCSAQRRAMDERCALADVAREQARRAADALREAQRAYDVLRDRVDRAEVEADPREVAAAKERLHSAFRAASDRASTAEETEAAARAWLNEINALNNAVREAQRAVEAGTADLGSRIGALERLSAEADAARIAGENAESGCRDAREALAGCEEAEARARDAIPPETEEPHPFDRFWPEDSPNLPPPGPGNPLAGLPLVVRVLRGDRDARERIVASLAAGDPEATRDWGLRISRLADAITGRAIEDGYLDLPDDDPFWRLFSHHESRDIVSALSALGFRYDGMGGFADGRVPAARDLSLAVGYAGLEAMRIRTWPREAHIALMYEGAVVAADEWLADQAGDLSLGRMVDALGNRAADLADVWNAWGRVRPALLST